jgi:hypothetical protein
MNEIFAWLSKSVTLWRGRRWSLGIDYWLLCGAGIEVLRLASIYGLISAAMLILAAIIYALGSVAGAAGAHGNLSRITASILIVRREMDLLAKPGPMALVGFAGPLTALACGFALMAVPRADLDPISQAFLASLMQWSLFFGFYNLLACWLFDGRLGWRGLLGLVLRPRHAVFATLCLAWISCGLLVWRALSGVDPLAILFTVMCVLATVKDLQAWRAGTDFVTDFPLPRNGGVSPWAKWQVAMAERASQRSAAKADAEQADLDRLLEKVSKEGLHSLTNAERATLAAISKRQREREAAL